MTTGNTWVLAQAKDILTDCIRISCGAHEDGEVWTFDHNVYTTRPKAKLIGKLCIGFAKVHVESVSGVPDFGRAQPYRLTVFPRKF